MPDEPDEPAAPRFTIRDAVVATVGAFLVGVVGGGIVLGALGYGSFDEAPLEVLVLAQGPLWAGLVGIPWLISRRRGTGDLRRDYGLTFRWRDVGAGLGAGVVTQVAVVALVPLYDLLGIDPDRVSESSQELGDKADDPLSIAVLVVMAVIGAAVTEEICYRGLWLKALDGRVRPAAAVAVSSLVFAVMHFQPLAIPPLALFGAVAAVLTLRSGRLGPAIWAHVGFNALAVVGLVGTG